jgi:hypothetical protein
LEISRIFNVSTNKQNVICPPDQVFAKQEFDYLLTIGGDLVNDETEYEKFRTTLSILGETKFYILENLGATITDRNKPFRIIINLTDDYKEFQEKVRAFDPPFGWTINHFFIYGQNENWGIYMAEFPSLNIIGCDKKFSDTFRQTFSICGNGYPELKEFIEKEFQYNTNQLKTFFENYKIESYV